MITKFNGLCDALRNDIVSSLVLIQRIQKLQTEAVALQGKLAHRLGSLEEAVKIFIEEEERKNGKETE